MKKIVAMLGLLLLFGTAVQAKKYALVVGVPSGFPPNSGIELDTSNMEKLLSRYGYNIKLLVDPRPKSLLKELRKYSKFLTPNDNFIFYYTGHGAQVPDANGDESDKKDEVICLKEKHQGDLSRGNYSSLLVDDDIYLALSKINSRKFVFFDSCHSGTAFKSSGKYISKTLGYFPNFVPKGVQLEAIPESQTETKASLLFFGAAKDGTSAQATNNGSMFTLSIIDALRGKHADLNKDGKITFRELEKYTKKNIKKLCENDPRLVFTPEMHAESFDLDADVIETLKSSGAAQTSSAQSTLENGFDNLLRDGSADSLKVSTKSRYRDGDSIKLTIDTDGSKGYLYVIYTDKKEHTILYPNKYASESQQVSGVITFPAKKFGRFRLKAGKPYGRTVIFTILSEEPLDIYDKGVDDIFNVFGKNSPKAISVLRGVSVKSTRMKIGKAVFDVRP